MQASQICDENPVSMLVRLLELDLHDMKDADETSQTKEPRVRLQQHALDLIQLR